MEFFSLATSISHPIISIMGFELKGDIKNYHEVNAGGVIVRLFTFN